MTLFSTGCGTSTSSGADALLRFLQASPDAPQVNVLIDGVSVAANLGYGNATGYISLKRGSHQVPLLPHGVTLPSFSQTISVKCSTNQTLLFTVPGASILS